MKSKLNMHPDVHNAEVTQLILYWKGWVFDRNVAIFIHIYNTYHVIIFFFSYSIVTVSSFHKQ